MFVKVGGALEEGIYSLTFFFLCFLNKYLLKIEN